MALSDTNNIEAYLRGLSNEAFIDFIRSERFLEMVRNGTPDELRMLALRFGERIKVLGLGVPHINK